MLGGIRTPGLNHSSRQYERQDGRNDMTIVSVDCDNGRLHTAPNGTLVDESNERKHHAARPGATAPDQIISARG